MARRETLRLDGIVTDEDIANRHYVIRQCDECDAYTRWDSRNKERYGCATCDSPHFDRGTQHSIRTHHIFLARKTRRKPRKRV